MLLWFVKNLHSAIGLFEVWGCFLPKQFLIYHVFLWPLIFLHWCMNDGKCILTTFEFKLGDTSLDSGDTWPSVRQNMSKFIDMTRISDENLKIFLYVVWTLSWGLSLARISNIL